MSALALSPDAVAGLARRLFGEPNRRLSSARELRWGRQGSLAVMPERGVFQDYETGTGGGVLDMVVHAGAAANRAEAALLLEQGGELPAREPDDHRQARQMQKAKDRAERVAAAGKLWNASAPIQGTVAETYLRICRGVLAPLDQAALRFHPAAPFYPYRPDNHRLPAMVAAVVDSRGAFIGGHITYLAADGRAKAEATPARKMVGCIAMGHVPLMSGKRLVVAEGVESALSAWEAAQDTSCGPGGVLGACAALSAGGMAALEWPTGTTALIIAPDHDASGTGKRAAHELAKRASERGLEVGFLYPPDGCGDWNDAARLGARA